MKKIIFYLFCVSMTALAACTKMDEPAESQVHVCPLNFNGTVVGYDYIPTKSSTAWANGDKVYIIFYKSDSTKIAGTATYSSTEGWKVSYEGILAESTNAKCVVKFFENPSSATDFIVGMTSNTIIYEDNKGTYSFTKGTAGSTITVNASLQPKTARIRFKGTDKDVINVTGISSYSSYSISNDKYFSVSSPVRLTVDSTGYTPYVYGFFADTTNRSIGLVTSDNAFTRTCEKEVLSGTVSGYMTIPTSDSYNSWRKGLYLKVKGIEFKMIPVAGHSTGFFLIGETELTEALYNRVTSSTSTSSSVYPRVNIYYDDVISFISSLNSLTGMNFDLPSKEQWEYAAKGGKYSVGFTYSGSSTASDVAWYSSNSGGSRHEVKQKNPNELGIYDMSGNVREYVKKFYKSSYYYWYYMGGYYSSVASGVTNTSGSYNSNSSSTYYDDYVSSNAYTGARLALKFN